MEIKRVLLSSPKRTPGRMFDGKNVNVNYTIPVTFSMDETDINEEPVIQSTNNKGERKGRKLPLTLGKFAFAMSHILRPIRKLRLEHITRCALPEYEFSRSSGPFNGKFHARY